MFHIFVLLALAGAPADIGSSTPTFDTKEACVAAIPAFVKKLQEELGPQGVEVTNATCATVEDAKKRIEGATSVEDAAKRLFGG